MTRELSSSEVNALHYELLVKDIVAAAEKLPPFPDVAWRVTALVKRMAPVKDIQEVVRYDQAITARILRLSRSAYYGRRFEVNSLQDAILLLGNKRLIQIIIAACAVRYFDAGAQRLSELWEHSVTAALVSEIIARHINQPKVLTVYTAALLHDIGKTILDIYLKIYLHSSQREQLGATDQLGAERRGLGIDHQELGGIVARNWRFPAEVIAAIEHHHSPERAGQHQDIASLVYMANSLSLASLKRKENPRYKGLDPEADPVFKKFSVTRKMAEDCLAELENSMEGVKEALRG
ncbi:MAG: HDOD domain-containing protein [Desulfobacteraceae bacterium]|nr:HDOD domain-containing protein [Desulfobacteraceae bacterium]